MGNPRKFKLIYGIVSLSYLMLGLVLLFYPGFSMLTLCYIFGVITLVYGVYHIVVYFMKEGTSTLFRLDFVVGLIAVAASLWMLVRPTGILKVLPIILGAFVVLSALMKLQYSIDLKKLAYDRWWLVLIFALVCLGLGGLLLARPFASAKTMTRVIGGVLALDGIAGIWTMVCISLQLRQIYKAEKKAQAGEGEIEDGTRSVSYCKAESTSEHQEEPELDGVPVDVEIELLPDDYFSGKE